MGCGKEMEVAAEVISPSLVHYWLLVFAISRVVLEPQLVLQNCITAVTRLAFLDLCLVSKL